MKNKSDGRAKFEAGADSIVAEATGLSVLGKDFALSTCAIDYTDEKHQPKGQIKVRLESESCAREVEVTFSAAKK